VCPLFLWQLNGRLVATEWEEPAMSVGTGSLSVPLGVAVWLRSVNSGVHNGVCVVFSRVLTSPHCASHPTAVPACWHAAGSTACVTNSVLLVQVCSCLVGLVAHTRACSLTARPLHGVLTPARCCACCRPGVSVWCECQVSVVDIWREPTGHAVVLSFNP
jgi:hypothetical protein